MTDAQKLADATLQPCPFCNALASLQCHGGIFGGDAGYRVECAGACHAMTCYWHTAEHALRNWNTRSAPALEIGRALKECQSLLADLTSQSPGVSPSGAATLTYYARCVETEARARAVLRSLGIGGKE